MCFTVIACGTLSWLSELVNADIGQIGSCDKLRLSLDAGACKSLSQGLQHLNIRGFWVTGTAALLDERICLRVSTKLCIFCKCRLFPSYNRRRSPDKTRLSHVASLRGTEPPAGHLP